MGFWSKLFGGGGKQDAEAQGEDTGTEANEPAAVAEGVEPPTSPAPPKAATREERSAHEQGLIDAEGADSRLIASPPEELDWDTGFLFRYDDEAAATEAFQRLREATDAVPNSRFELRKNLPRDAGGHAVSGTPPFLVIVLTVHEINFLDPRGADRLLRGGPEAALSVAKRKGALRIEREATEELEAFESTRVATLPRHSTRLRACASFTFTCADCGASVTVRTRDIHPVEGREVGCEFCPRKVLVCPSVFDEPAEDGLNPNRLGRLLPLPLRAL